MKMHLRLEGAPGNCRFVHAHDHMISGLEFSNSGETCVQLVPFERVHVAWVLERTSRTVSLSAWSHMHNHGKRANPKIRKNRRRMIVVYCREEYFLIPSA